MADEAATANIEQIKKNGIDNIKSITKSQKADSMKTLEN